MAEPPAASKENDMTEDLRWEGPFAARPVYTPAVRPGFTAWATVFAFSDGDVGLSFDETVRERNPVYRKTRLEMAEAACVPVSYGSVECGTEDQTVYRVFMRSSDGLRFRETGRCLRALSAYCCAALPDGRLIGFDVPRRNDDGTAWADWLRVQESLDGGSTWQGERRLLEGTVPYMWRVRTLRDGTVILLLSLQGSPWGVGRDRETRHTLFPGEDRLNLVQACFMTTRDGKSFSPPHYILPGIGAHEYDVCEPEEGTLLFIAGDVQGTPAGRQEVRRTADGWLNGPLMPIGRGAPEDPASDPQGGFLPETLIWDDRTKCILGYRRNKGYCLSSDRGENWTRTFPDTEVPKLYQPVMMTLPGGMACTYGHTGGDNAFGQADMAIWGHVLRPDCALHLPAGARLTLKRCTDPSGNRFVNSYEAKLICPGRNVSGKRLLFRYRPFWNADGSVNTDHLGPGSAFEEAETDAEGVARVHIGAFDDAADIHLAYVADVSFPGDEDVAPCPGPSMTVLALTPVRGDPFPYDGYFSEGILYLSPSFLKDFPEAVKSLRTVLGREDLPEGTLPKDARERLISCGALKRKGDGRLCWIRSVHARRSLDDVRPMMTGDVYE